MNKNLLSAASFLPKSLVFPYSWVGHIPFVDFLIREIRPKMFVELGTHTGNSYFSFCQAISENKLDTKCYAVDTWGGDEHAGKYTHDVYLEVSDYNSKNYAEFSILLRMTFDDALAKFEDGTVNLLHIDGLHTYEAVKHDFESWLPKLAPGAVVIFHDTQVRERDFGVWKLWEELLEEYPNSMEFVHSNGLGVLQLNNSPSLALEWLKKGSDQQISIKGYFESLGTLVFEKAMANELTRERDELTRERDELTRERDEAREYIENIYQTRSWQYTRHLRFLAHTFRRCRHVFKDVIKHIRLYGFFSFFYMVINLTRTVGFRGLFYKIFTSEATFPSMDSQKVYQKWIKSYDTSTSYNIFIQRIKSIWHVNKKFSLVLNLKNPSEFYIKRLIDSLLLQAYQNWELIITIEEPSSSQVKEILETYSVVRSKIKLIEIKKNESCFFTLNKMIEQSSGEWLVNVGERDLVSPKFLFSLSEVIDRSPSIAIIYTDDDLIDKNGERKDYYFKPDWNVDLFYSQDYLGNSVCFRKAIVDQLGGYKQEYEEIANFDLILRMVEKISDSQIHHIPKILYHYEQRPEPFAPLKEKSLSEHFSRQNIDAKVKFLDPVFRVQYSIPNEKPLVSLIIPTRNGLHLISKCVESILQKTTYPNYEIIIVDNDSDDPEVLDYLEKIQLDTRVKVINDNREFNYSAINNSAVVNCQGKFIGLINNDIEVISPEWLNEMVSHASREKVGAVGARLWYSNDTIQHAGVLLIGGVACHAFCGLKKNQKGYQNREISTQRYSAVTAACLLVKKSIYIEVEGLNENDLKVAFNDVDFCLRLQEIGYKNIWTPYAELYHHESATRGSDTTIQKRKRFEQEILYMQSKWSDILSDDPFYNPNLSWIKQGELDLNLRPRQR